MSRNFLGMNSNFAAQSHMPTGHNFAKVPVANIPRSAFDRSHSRKMTFNAGDLVPCFLDEVLPGDTYNVQMTQYTRLATPIYPIMDNIFLDSFFFFVPWRLVWPNSEKFFGAQDNPGDSTSYVIPTTTPAAAVAANSLANYFGIPGVAGTNGKALNTLPFRSYRLIWNDWFRDENLQNSLAINFNDGPDTFTTVNTLQKRGKRHDYFTSCLPWPQKGPSVPLPLSGNAPVIGLSVSGTAGNTGVASYDAKGNTIAAGASPYGIVATNTVLNVQGQSAAAFSGSNAPQIFADLSAVTAATINQLRQSIQIQVLYERDARGGTRYTEIVKAHFGVTSPDSRLQRPEYLGGGSTRINISAIPQTSGTGASGTTTPMGQLSAYGVSTSTHGFVKSFVEHGYVMGFVSARADITYQYGLNKLWTRSTRLDVYWPDLAVLGEQAVLNQEIYIQGTSADLDPFGYQERYAEYRFKPSEVVGTFASYASTPLDAWHLADKYSSLPTLGSNWIVDQPPMSRVKAVTTQPDFLFDSHFKVTCVRPMPVFGVPGQILRM